MAFAEIIRAFNAQKVSYVIVGGMATVLHGHARFTADIDFVIRLDEPNVRAAVAAIGALGYQPRIPANPNDLANPEVRESWIRDRGMMVFSFFHPEDALRGIDLFAKYPIDYSELLERAIVKNIGQDAATVCSIEDLIALKQSADRPIDRDDIQALEIILGHRPPHTEPPAGK